MKRLFILIILSIAASLLVACKGEELFEGNGEIFSGEWEVYPDTHLVSTPVEIDFWSANSAVDVHGVEMAAVVADFNQYQQATYPANPIRVNISFQGGYVNQNTKLQAALISKTNPDIAMVGVSSMAIYKDNVLDVRNYLTFDQIRNIHEGFRQFAMYQDVFVGYPYFAASNVILLNRTEADKTGLDIQTVDEILADPDNSTWTWEQSMELAKRMTHDIDENTKFYGMAASNIAGYESWFTQGVSIYNETATKPNFNNEAGIRALTYWRNIVKDGYMENPVLDPNHGTKIQANFIEGKVGMLHASSSAVRQIYNNVNGAFEIDILPSPKYTDFYTNQSGGGIIIFQGKNQNRVKAAVEFMKWLYADAQQVRYSTNTGYLATTKSATTSEAWLAYKEINPLLDRVVKLMSLGLPEGTRLPIGRAKALADDDFAKYVKAIWYDNYERDLQDVLDELDERIAYILEFNS